MFQPICQALAVVVRSDDEAEPDDQQRNAGSSGSLAQVFARSGSFLVADARVGLVVSATMVGACSCNVDAVI